jgi:polyribonucleotide nucleotidyltransferase
METDEKGRIKLSMKALAERPAGGSDRPAPAERGEREPRQSREGGRQSADQQQQQQQHKVPAGLRRPAERWIKLLLNL